MGGRLVDRENVKVPPLHLHHAENQYGELCIQLMGVIMRGAGHLITRIHSWKIQRLTDEAEDNTELDFRAPPDGATWTWSSVNNCTKYL